jgi:hypothetical protein
VSCQGLNPGARYRGTELVAELWSVCEPVPILGFGAHVDGRPDVFTARRGNRENGETAAGGRVAGAAGPRATPNTVNYSPPWPVARGLNVQTHERTLTVTGEQVEELLAAVRRSWTAAHEEQASTEGLGNFAALGARLVVGDRTVEISVRGRTSEWGTAGERLGERSRTLVAQASSLAWAVKRLVDAAPGP